MHPLRWQLDKYILYLYLYIVFAGFDLCHKYILYLYSFDDIKKEGGALFRELETSRGA